MSVPKLYHNKDGSVTIAFPYDRVFIEQIKEWIPAWSREYDPGSKTWTIGIAYAAEIEPRMRARFGYIETYGSPGGPRFDTGHGHKPDADHQKLYVTQDAPLTVIKAAYRALSKELHPDNGGDHSQMIQLTEAYERVSGGAR